MNLFLKKEGNASFVMGFVSQKTFFLFNLAPGIPDDLFVCVCCKNSLCCQLFPLIKLITKKCTIKLKAAMLSAEESKCVITLLRQTDS